MQPQWLQIAIGTSAIVAIVATLFTFVVNWVVKTVVDKSLLTMKADLMKSISEGYVSRAENTLMEERAKEIHSRHDKEIDQIWSRLNSIGGGKAR